MIDPRCEAVLIADRDTGQFADKTDDVVRYRSGRAYPYGPDRVRILGNPARVPLPSGTKVEVRGAVWEYATEVWAFTGPVGAWWRIFSRRQEGEELYYTYPASQVRIVMSAAQAPASAEVLRYWRDIVSRLPDDDPLQRPYGRLNFVHPESVLGCYLAGAPIVSRERPPLAIFPFRCNISQRKAVELGLTRSVSVIEGPPGTGKTETILNLIANIITAQAGTVGVVSFTNAAVDNVREKLDELGFGHVIAGLGRREKREEFFAGQATRNARVTSFAGSAPPAPPPPERMDELDRRLRDLLAAGLALSCCRNVVVVGDLRQLPPIVNDAADGLVSPRPAYDYREHSILSSLIALYPDDLPRTLLREHYRCDPAIIGFCNKAFYDGELIPFTTSDAERPMIVWRTVEGNHMRQHRGGGRSNQREVDVIVTEVIPAHCAGVLSADIGITTPYRRQVDRVADALIAQIEADTVHKFQGRQKQVVILTTVLDEGWRGRTGLAFADDPQKINVAVSRAVRRFILVTNHAMMPTSRYIRDLIGYIRYHNPDEEVVDSAVISMFDLLYRDYNHRLRPLAARLRNELAYKSEDIIWTALHDILAEDRYAHLTVSHQVLVRNLLVDLSRLTPRQEAFVRRRASVDFVVYNRVTNRPLLAIEVDGFTFHENNPAQLERDTLKNEILRIHRMPLLRLPTTGSLEDQRIRLGLDAAEAHWGLALRAER